MVPAFELLKVNEYRQQRNKVKLTFLIMLSTVLFVQEINLVHLMDSMEHNEAVTLAWLYDSSSVYGVNDCCRI